MQDPMPQTSLFSCDRGSHYWPSVSAFQPPNFLIFCTLLAQFREKKKEEKACCKWIWGLHHEPPVMPEWVSGRPRNTATPIHHFVQIHKSHVRPNKKRSLLRLTRPNVFWSADRTLFSNSLPILFGVAPCVASCVVDHDREREVDE